MNIINGDCLEVLKTLPDKSVDLFICDLPYGCLTNQPKADGTEGKSKGGKMYSAETGCSWDIKLDLNAFWIQVKRLCKNDHTPVLMFCNTKFGYDLIKSNEDWFRYDLVWNKEVGVGFLNANKQPLRSHEMVYVFSKKSANYKRIDIEVEGAKQYVDNRNQINNGIYGSKQQLPHSSKEGIRCVKSVIEVANKKAKGQHPTAKPVELYKFLIERYSKKDDTVLDPTFGSGNSGRASAELERKYVGIEKDKTFFDKYKSSTDINVLNQVPERRQEVQSGVQ